MSEAVVGKISDRDELHAVATARPSMGLAVYSLATRELVRFFRQRTRIVGALGQPIIFWVLFGAGLQGSFRDPSATVVSGIFLSGRRDHDRHVHGDLFDNLGD